VIPPGLEPGAFSDALLKTVVIWTAQPASTTATLVSKSAPKKATINLGENILASNKDCFVLVGDGAARRGVDINIARLSGSIQAERFGPDLQEHFLFNWQDDSSSVNLVIPAIDTK
jgi:hypothetical protein